MPTLAPLPSLYLISINENRCPSGKQFVLEPNDAIVELQERDPSHETQKWRVIPTFDDEDQRVSWSGVVFENSDTRKALVFVGQDEGLTTRTWHADQHDDAYVWNIRPSRDEKNHADESSIWSLAAECVIDAQGNQACHGARALGYRWKGNDNQYWIIERA